MMHSFPHPKLTKAIYVAERQASYKSNWVIDESIWDDFFANAPGPAFKSALLTVNRRLNNGQLSRVFSSNDYLTVATAIGIPAIFLYLEDQIFNAFGVESEWPVQFAQAIPEGADLNPALRRILIRILRDEVMRFTNSDKLGERSALSRVCAAINGQDNEQIKFAAENADHVRRVAQAAYDATRDAQTAIRGGPIALAAYAKTYTEGFYKADRSSLRHADRAYTTAFAQGPAALAAYGLKVASTVTESAFATSRTIAAAKAAYIACNIILYPEYANEVVDFVDQAAYSTIGQYAYQRFADILVEEVARCSNKSF